MKQFLCTFLGIFTLFSSSFSQILWTGPSTTFSKSNFADWTLAENQDRITEEVWITRANNQGIFNIAAESGFDKTNRTSPIHTEWAIGSIADGVENLSFSSWFQTLNMGPAEQINLPKVLHIIPGDIYIDIKITSWTQGPGGSGVPFGGGFSYVRSTDPNTNLSSPFPSLCIYPNPAKDFIYIKGIQGEKEITISDISGTVLIKKKVNHRKAINISSFSSGIYILEIASSFRKKLIKI